ncbi:MAG: ABC transporter permease [Candidatus Kapabacteria bacterium]|nr:ABC transporter permease [Candidatus Kapabacteria bacterium]
MNIPLYYILKNFVARKLTTSLTVFGVALVMFVFVAALMMSNGIRKTLAQTGSPDNVIVTRKSSTGEITSIIDRITGDNILTLNDVKKAADGTPIATTDAVVIINLYKNDGGMSNVTVRGVGKQALALRPNVKLTAGRMFTFGARELVVGSSITKRFNGAGIGEKIKLAGDKWTIVGVIDAGSSGFNSELWCDVEQLQQAFNRSQYSTLTFRITDPNNIKALKMQFAGDPRLNQFEPEIETVYFAKQSETLSMFISVLGIIITIIFAVGAVIGAVITMYASVANRVTEIGTLRAVGFGKGSILTAFLIESIVMSLTGGLIGIFIASFLQFFTISTLNFDSFSELAFSFSLSPFDIALAIVFSITMGIVGGFLPAYRAAGMTIVNALRGA